MANPQGGGGQQQMVVGTEPYVLEIKSKLLIYRLFAAAMNQL